MNISRDRKRVWVDKEFEQSAKKIFPCKSMYQVTKELNKMLEDVLYGAVRTENKQKRKHN